MKPFVFLDRDGTLIVEKNYLHDPGGVEVIEGAAEAIRRLHDGGFGVALITNQSAIGRGYFGLERLQMIHQRLEDLLAADGATLDAIYVCPHTPDDGCACRKPGIDMITTAAGDHEVDLKRSFIIGDKECDIDCGINAGLTTILVRTGYGSRLETEIGERADYVADNLLEAADWILNKP